MKISAVVEMTLRSVILQSEIESMLRTLLFIPLHFDIRWDLCL